MEKIKIYGAGISGLVAGINLAKAGFEAEIIESRKTVGGDPKWHPSVHLQYMDIDRTSEYIGIDISRCFRRAVSHSIYFYDKKTHAVNPPNAFLCLKGGHENSIEKYLYKIACGLGVKFIYDQPLDQETLSILKKDRSKAIVSCGLEIPAYQICGIKYKMIHGFRASGITPNKNIAVSCFGDYTNGEFAYLASYDDCMFGLLFSRNSMNSDSLKRFEDFIWEKEKISFETWTFSSGCIPQNKNIEKEGIVLAGTMSGMIDPFYLNGISGALLSGKIVSDYFINEKFARKEFSRMTRNFYTKKLLQDMSTKITFKRIFFPLLVLCNNRLKTVGGI
ncbi:MAG: NAD(P)-binding protein [PVC group bacterium]|nr:NAD(P)-binding protein [PVC group bacterium]